MIYISDGLHPAPIRQLAAINRHKESLAICQREFSREPSPVTRLSSCGYHFSLTSINSILCLYGNCNSELFKCLFFSMITVCCASLWVWLWRSRTLRCGSGYGVPGPSCSDKSGVLNRVRGKGYYHEDGSLIPVYEIHGRYREILLCAHSTRRVCRFGWSIRFRWLTADRRTGYLTSTRLCCESAGCYQRPSGFHL